MKIFTKIILDMETGSVLLQEYYDYNGFLELACGPTAAQKAAQQQEAAVATSESNYLNTLNADFSNIFAQNEAILQSIQTAMEPIVAAGPNQFGFSPEQTASMRTEASDQNAQAANQAQIAAGAKEATAGGEAFIPSGANLQIGATINNQANLAAAQAQENITQAGYQQGKQDFFAAENALAGAPGTLGQGSSQFGSVVTGAGNSASTGAEAAMSGATQIQQAQDAWIAPVAGLLGSLGGGAINKIWPTPSGPKSA